MRILMFANSHAAGSGLLNRGNKTDQLTEENACVFPYCFHGKAS
jgi:hypothetical protein